MFGIRAVGISRLTSVAAAVVAYTKSLVLSLKGDSAYNKNQNATILDRSPNDLVITRGGDAAQTVSSFSPFSSTWSSYFDGTGDYMSVPSSSAFDFGTGDFTIEFWVNFSSLASANMVLTKGYPAVSAAPFLFYNDASNNLLFFASSDGTNWIVPAGTTIISAASKAAWYHVAVTRSGSTFRTFVNGAQVSTFSSSASLVSNAQALTIGSGSGGNNTMNGYVSNLRIVKGTALYTAAFTPATTALTAVSGTSLLTCHSGRLFDGSSNAADISVFGNTSASTFSPFDKVALTGSVGGSSVLFNGTSDYISSANSSVTNFGTSDFTVECWAYRTSTGSATRYIMSVGSTENFAIQWTGSNLIFSFSGTTVNSYAYTFPLNNWVHIAVARSGSTCRMFINGTQVSSVSNSTNVAASSNPVLVGAYTGANYFGGYISDARIVKGTAVYTASFTPPTSPLTAISGTTYLTCQGNTFSDNSTNNATVSAVGSARLSGLNPYGAGSGWGVLFNGSSSYLSVPSSTAFDFGTGDFTIECWAYRTAAGTGDRFLVSRGNSANFLLRWNAAGNIQFYLNTNVLVHNYTYAFPTNTWVHIAVTRSGSTSKLFINGAEVSSVSNSTSVASTVNGVLVGGYTTSDFFAGYISNLRVVKGTAVYTAAFTPSTAALTAVSGTSLLTLQDNTYKDNSSNAFTITPSNAPAIRAVGPFTASTLFPGSIYFDGSNDYLTIPSSASMNILGGDFTIECWFNPVAFNASNYNYLIMQDDGGSDSQNFQLTCTAAGLVQLTTWNTSARASAFGVSSTRTVKLGAWNHIAVTHVKSSNTTRLFLNGALEASSTTAIWAGSTQPTCIGNWNNGQSIQNATYGKLNGYLSGVRLIKGEALYTAAFTPPTAPPTVTAGTTLLLNFNDGGIIDAYGSSGPFFTTTGTVVTNNVTKKYGTGSLFFPSNSSSLLAGPIPGVAFGTGDFTIECWVNSTNANNTGDAGIMGIYTAAFGSVTPGGPVAGLLGIKIANGSSGLINFVIGGAQQTGTISVSNATWTHVALCRSGSTVRLFVGGVLSKKVTSATNITGQYIAIGSTYGTAYSMNGYIDNMEIHSGYAKYTSDTSFMPE